MKEKIINLSFLISCSCVFRMISSVGHLIELLGFLPSNAVGLCMTDFTVSIGSGEGSCKFFFPRFEKYRL